MVPSKKCTRTGSDQSKEWVKSTCTEADINALVFDGVLPDQSTARWRAAVGEWFSTPETDELIVL